MGRAYPIIPRITPTYRSLLAIRPLQYPMFRMPPIPLSRRIAVPIVHSPSLGAERSEPSCRPRALTPQDLCPSAGETASHWSPRRRTVGRRSPQGRDVSRRSPRGRARPRRFPGERTKSRRSRRADRARRSPESRTEPHRSGAASTASPGREPDSPGRPRCRMSQNMTRS